MDAVLLSAPFDDAGFLSDILGLEVSLGPHPTGAVLRDRTQAARLAFLFEVLGRVPAQQGDLTQHIAPDDASPLEQAVRDPRYGPLGCKEILRHVGKTAVSEMRHMAPFFFARAWAQGTLAQDTSPTTLRRAAGPEDYQIHGDRGGYDGFFRLRAFDLSYRRFDGSDSGRLERSGFVAYDAALVLPYDPVSDQVLLVEQIRFGPLLREDPQPWLLEAVAGVIDAGESPEDAAHREAEEEAGLHLRALRKMVKIYASPGYSSEYYHCFLGLCDLSAHVPGVGGLASESENIRNHLLSFDAALALVESGEINAGPLVMMLLWLARERPHLRGAA